MLEHFVGSCCWECYTNLILISFTIRITFSILEAHRNLLWIDFQAIACCGRGRLTWWLGCHRSFLVVETFHSVRAICTRHHWNWVRVFFMGCWILCTTFREITARIQLVGLLGCFLISRGSGHLMITWVFMSWLIVALHIWHKVFFESVRLPEDIAWLVQIIYFRKLCSSCKTGCKFCLLYDFVFAVVSQLHFCY